MNDEYRDASHRRKQDLLALNPVYLFKYDSFNHVIGIKNQHKHNCH
jgi:hypothetical protein